MHFFDIIVTLFNGLGLMALVAVLYGSIQRLRVSRSIRFILQGLIFGLGALITMMTPATLAPGVLIDARTVFVALAAAFIGPVAAVIAAIIPGTYRIMLGGAGLPVGLATLTLAFIVGLVWRYAWFKRRPVTTTGLLVLGAAISSQCLLAFFLPFPLTASFMISFGGSLTVSALFATQVLGTMIQRENRLIAREKSLIDDAYTDALTLLPNRRALFGAETGLLAASSRKGFVVFVLDIDHFKTINDRYGHDVGDTALCILSETLKNSARAGDVVCRFGGEEFVVALPDTRAEEGWAVAERMLAHVRERKIVLAEAEFGMTVSIGIAHAHGTALNAAIARADEALYRAKAEGRDRIVAAPPQGRIAPQRPAASDPDVPSPAAFREAVHRAP